MVGSVDCFADAIRPSPVEGPDEELERCLWHISFSFLHVLSCYYARIDWLIILIGPRTVGESAYKDEGRVRGRD
jgi:hypothetical protein